MRNKRDCCSRFYRRSRNSLQRFMRSLNIPRPPRHASQRRFTIQPHHCQPINTLSIQPCHQWPPLFRQHCHSHIQSRHNSNGFGLCSLFEERHRACTSWLTLGTRQHWLWFSSLAQAVDERWSYRELGGSIQSQHSGWEPTCDLCWDACYV